MATIYGYVYVLENVANGKCYVGQAISPLGQPPTLAAAGRQGRIWKHVQTATRGGSDCCAIHYALRVHGVDSFVFRIVEASPDAEALDQAEQRWITECHSLAPDGYNEVTGGRARRFGPQLRQRLKEAQNKPETQAKRREALAAFYLRPGSKEERSRAIKASHTPEVRTKMSAVAKTVQNKPEVKARQLEARNKPEVKERHRRKTMEALAHPNVRSRHLEAISTRCQTPEAKSKRSASVQAFYATHLKKGAKVTDAVIDQVQQAYASGDFRMKDLAVLHNLSLTTISHIVRGNVKRNRS